MARKNAPRPSVSTRIKADRGSLTLRPPPAAFLLFARRGLYRRRSVCVYGDVEQIPYRRPPPVKRGLPLCERVASKGVPMISLRRLCVGSALALIFLTPLELVHATVEASSPPLAQHEPPLPPKPPLKPIFASPFSFSSLKEMAGSLAKTAYTPPESISSPWLKDLNYDTYREIRFDGNHAVWRQESLTFNLALFHLGALYTQPVQIYEINDGMSYRLGYDPALFDFGKLTVPEGVTNQISDYAGFRIHYPINRPDYFDEFIVFLGASYFRGVGRGQVYGLSARGLAIDTARPKGEEFPVFTKFWIEKPAPYARNLTVYALLDSPSMTGAYRFVITPGRTTVMDIDAHLYARKDIERLGIAPLTSMFAFGENDNRLNRDFRPEVHDSDGLLLHNGNGEWLWRPLVNPRDLGVSTYSLENPRGFGLIQRDVSFASYEDLEARYEDRPGLWVEPKGDWGRGAVQLVEIPTDSEIHDNIVSYWVPEKPVKAGDALSFSYALGWGEGPDRAGRPAEIIATRVGRQFAHDETKFVIDFEGLSGRNRGEKSPPEVDLWVNAGEILHPTVVYNPSTKGWRVTFELRSTAKKVHELRGTLVRNGHPVSETWSYQWRPEQ